MAKTKEPAAPKPTRIYTITLNPRQKGVEPTTTTIEARAAFIDHRGHLCLSMDHREPTASTSFRSEDCKQIVAAFVAGSWVSFSAGPDREVMP